LNSYKINQKAHQKQPAEIGQEAASLQEARNTLNSAPTLSTSTLFFYQILKAAREIAPTWPKKRNIFFDPFKITIFSVNKYWYKKMSKYILRNFQ